MRQNEGRHGFGADGARECQTGQWCSKGMHVVQSGLQISSRECEMDEMLSVGRSSQAGERRRGREEEEKQKRERRRETKRDEEERRTGGHVLVALVPMRQAIYSSAKGAGKARGNADIYRIESTDYRTQSSLIE